MFLGPKDLRVVIHFLDLGWLLHHPLFHVIDRIIYLFQQSAFLRFVDYSFPISSHQSSQLYPVSFKHLIETNPRGFARGWIQIVGLLLPISGVPSKFTRAPGGQTVWHTFNPPPTQKERGQKVVSNICSISFDGGFLHLNSSTSQPVTKQLISLPWVLTNSLLVC